MIGFPIWWNVAPTIINTFLESYDLSGNTIIPVAPSGGSDLDKTNEKLLPSCPNSNLRAGKVLNRANRKEIAEWVNAINI